MSRPSAVDTKLIERFLRTQHFRHPATPKNYAGTLRNFNGFVAQHGAGGSPTVSIVQQWLKERSLKWPAHILYHRTFLVERYLKWLQNQEMIASNPFTELHRQYDPRTTPNRAQRAASQEAYVVVSGLLPSVANTPVLG